MWACGLNIGGGEGGRKSVNTTLGLIYKSTHRANRLTIGKIYIRYKWKQSNPSVHDGRDASATRVVGRKPTARQFEFPGSIRKRMTTQAESSPSLERGRGLGKGA